MITYRDDSGADRGGGGDRQCDYCGNAFPVPPSASHKRFCSQRCRMSWHEERRQAAMARLRQEERQMPDEEHQASLDEREHHQS